MLDFQSIDLDNIGTKCGLRDHSWSRLKVRFTDSENDHNYEVAVDALVPMRPDATMREVEEAARSSAIATLEAALHLLQGSSVAELREREHAAEDEQKAERRRDWEEKFPGAENPF